MFATGFCCSYCTAVQTTLRPVHRHVKLFLEAPAGPASSSEGPVKNYKVLIREYGDLRLHGIPICFTLTGASERF